MEETTMDYQDRNLLNGSRRWKRWQETRLRVALLRLPRDVIMTIAKRHPLLIPPFTNKTLHRAVKDYLAGGAKKKRIVEKYGEIGNWDTSRVTSM